MNSNTTRILVSSISIFVLSLCVLAYVIFSQMTAGKRLVSFRQNIEAWDVLNRASVTLDSDDVEGVPASTILRSLVLQDEKDTIAFLAHLDDLGRQTNVVVSTSELKSVKAPASGFDEIAATVSLRGLPTAVDDMIALLENLPYRSRIEKMTLTRMNGTAEAAVEIRVSIIE